MTIQTALDNVGKMARYYVRNNLFYDMEIKEVNPDNGVAICEMISADGEVRADVIVHSSDLLLLTD